MLSGTRHSSVIVEGRTLERQGMSRGTSFYNNIQPMWMLDFRINMIPLLGQSCKLSFNCWKKERKEKGLSVQTVTQGGFSITQDWRHFNLHNAESSSLCGANFLASGSSENREIKVSLVTPRGCAFGKGRKLKCLLRTRFFESSLLWRERIALSTAIVAHCWNSISANFSCDLEKQTAGYGGGNTLEISVGKQKTQKELWRA